MSLSKSEQNLPQYCYCHPRDAWRSFTKDEGKFVSNNRLFICSECLQAKNKAYAELQLRKQSKPELDVHKFLDSHHVVFKHHYKLDGWEYDFFFPNMKLLVEIDGSKHRTSKNTQNIDSIKDKCAKRHGYSIIRVPTGPGLLKRLSDNIQAYLVREHAPKETGGLEPQELHTEGVSSRGI